MGFENKIAEQIRLSENVYCNHYCHTWSQLKSIIQLLLSCLFTLKKYTIITIVTLGHILKNNLKSLLPHLVTFKKVYYNYYCHTWSHLKKYTTITIVTLGHI
jgi:hypothetical protein